MDSPLGSSPRRRRFGKPGAAAAGAGPFACLQRHPVAAAAVYMLIGGCVGEYINSRRIDVQSQQYMLMPAWQQAGWLAPACAISSLAARLSVLTGTILLTFAVLTAQLGGCIILDMLLLHASTQARPAYCWLTSPLKHGGVNMTALCMQCMASSTAVSNGSSSSGMASCAWLQCPQQVSTLPHRPQALSRQQQQQRRHNCVWIPVSRWVPYCTVCLALCTR